MSQIPTREAIIWREYMAEIMSCESTIDLLSAYYVLMVRLEELRDDLGIDFSDWDVDDDDE